MNDSSLRALCHRFLDAYENRRVDELAAIYAPDCIVWHNVFGRETSGSDNLAALPAGSAQQRRRSYDDRSIDTFEGGFVVRYTLAGVQHSGHRGALWICIVALCRDGRITRIDEYMDSGKFAQWAGVKPDAVRSALGRAAERGDG
jgi:ketosteroid isomerase-like protein